MRDIAKLFPDSVRSQMLTENWISNATVSWSSKEMQKLMILWGQYVEPGIKINCAMCFERILRNYRELQVILIELEQDSRLLDGK